MSKKSDFTQKLLNDLRLRKQRLAAASDGPENLYRPYQRQGETVGHKTKSHHQPSHGRRKPVAVEDFSTAIVPIQGGRGREYITDLSMALAFALENGGRLGNIQFLGNAAMKKKGSLYPGQSRTVDLGNLSSKFMAERNQLVPSRSNLSHIHITDISKGAQRLNQILKACSQGLNFDSYSIEIGKELLKGAVDLEESLRMLVSLQQASQYMVSPERKHRVQLHEVNDDEEAEIQDKRTKYPEKPRFSFDKSSRNSMANGKETKKTSIPSQKLPIPPYAPNSKMHRAGSDGHSMGTPNSVSHRGPVNFGPDSEVISAPTNGTRNVRSIKPSSLIKSKPPVITSNNGAPISRPGNNIKQSSSQGPEQEKARIPNVIAKLMGLEEVPLKTDSREMEKVSDLGQVTRKQRSTRQVDAMISNYERPVSQITQQVMLLQAHGIAALRNTTIATVQNTSTLKGNFERVDFYINPQTSTRADQNNQTHSAKMEGQERESTRRKDQTSTGRSEYAFGRARGPVSSTDFQEKHREYQEVADSDNAGMKRSTLQKPVKNTNARTPMLGNQQGFVYDRESKGPTLVRKSQNKESKQNREVEKNAKCKPQGMEGRKTDVVSKILQKEMLEVNIQKKMLQRNQIIVADKKDSSQNANSTQPKENVSSTNAESNTRKSVQRRNEDHGFMATQKASTTILPAEPMKTTNELSVQKAVAQPFEAKERKTTQTEEAKHRTDRYSHDNTRRKQKTAALQELQQRRHEHITKVKEPMISIQTMKLKENLQQKNVPASISSDHAWDDGERQKETEESTADHAWDETKESTIPCINSIAQTELHPPEIHLGGDQASKSDFKAIQSKGTGPEDNNAIWCTNAIPEQFQPHAKPEKQGRSLTKHEKHLKEILINSQHFLNSAEALFGLQIPIEILHNSHNKHQQQSNQLVLDCGYEIMKRKGERRELVFHPSVGIPIVPMKVKCLDDLVKVLHEDMENLQFRGDLRGTISDTTAAYLQGLLKGDVQDIKTDVNCMWDLGWKRKAYTYLEKNEVVKDVEKHILNRLIDEIIGDLLHISIGKN